jgi:hypothetical protein
VVRSREIEIGRTCGMHVKKETCIAGKPKGIRLTERLGIDRRVLLSWILEN